MKPAIADRYAPPDGAVWGVLQAAVAILLRAEIKRSLSGA